MHGIEDETEIRIAQTFPVYQFLERIEIRGAWLQRLDQIRARRQRWHALLQYHFEFLLDLRNDRRKRAAAVAGLVLDAVPAIRIVACGDDDAAGRAAMPHKIGNRRRGTGLVREPHGSSGGADHFGDCGGNAICGIAMVVADEHALACVLIAHHIPRNRVRYSARIRERKVLRDYPAPAIGPEFDRSHRKLRKVYAKREVCQTAGLAR